MIAQKKGTPFIKKPGEKNLESSLPPCDVDPRCQCRQWQKSGILFLKHKCDLSGASLEHLQLIEGRFACGEILSAEESLSLALLIALCSGWDTVGDVYETLL